MSNGIDSKYVNYQEMVTRTSECLSMLSGVCSDLGLDVSSEKLAETRERMSDHVFSVGIMGEFKRGKSTVINALLGKEIVPADIVPTSATLNYVRWDSVPSAEVHFKDGSSRTIAVEDLSSFVTKITPENEAMAATVQDAVVLYPCNFCQNGVQIVDTPGLNDDERMNEISERVIPTLDAIIMVMVPDSPFSQSEAEFVRTKVMTSDLGRIIFVVNKIDTIRKRDRQRLLDSIASKIRQAVLEKTASVYGEGSPEYQATLMKVGSITVLGVSAADALDGKIDGDDELLASSGFPEFEKALATLLTEERGIIELVAPVERLIATANDVATSIQTRRNALQTDQAEVERIASEGRKAIERERKNTKKRISELRDKAGAVYGQLLPEVETCYSDIQDWLLNYVDTLSISSDDLDSDAAVEAKVAALQNEMNNKLVDQLSQTTERLLSHVQANLGRDVKDLESLAAEIYATINEASSALGSNGTSILATGGASALGVILSGGVGGFAFGGAIEGWKEHGMSGAAIGGGAGLVGGYLAVQAVGLALGAAGIAFTAPMTIPILMIASVASSFVGKAATRYVFRKSRAERNVEVVRQQLRLGVNDAMKTMREQRVLENWLRDTTQNIYNDVADSLNKEVEAALSAYDAELSNLQADQHRKQSEIEQLNILLQNSEKSVVAVLKSIMPVHQKLAHTLSAAV